jgi:hypothetical protein
VRYLRILTVLCLVECGLVVSDLYNAVFAAITLDAQSVLLSLPDNPFQGEGEGNSFAMAGESLLPTTYSTINGTGTSVDGIFNYWDGGYTGSGNRTMDGAFLSGGLGKLTDGIISTQRFDMVSNLQGTGEYVGWRGGVQVNPLITFNFPGSPVIDTIDIYLDNTGFGGVFAPASILIDGVNRPFTAPTLGTVGRIGFAGLGLVGPEHTVQLIQGGSSWVMVSEIVFNAAIPEPNAMLLSVVALAGVIRFRHRTVG